MAKITTKLKKINVKPTFNYSSPVGAHLKSNGRYPRNPNAVPGKRGQTYNGPQFTSRQADAPIKASKSMYKVGHTEDLKQLTKSNIKSVVNTQSSFTPKVNYNISASDKKAISKYQPAPTTGSPRGHYATRMAQGLLNRPTSDAARKKLYKK